MTVPAVVTVTDAIKAIEKFELLLSAGPQKYEYVGRAWPNVFRRPSDYYYVYKGPDGYWLQRGDKCMRLEVTSMNSGTATHWKHTRYDVFIEWRNK